MAIAHLQSNVTIRSGLGARGGLSDRASRCIEYWALTTSLDMHESASAAARDPRPRGLHCHVRSREQARTENLLILVRSLIVEAPGARENRGVKSAQSNGGLADEDRFLCHHGAHGRTRCWLHRRTRAAGR